MPAKNNAEYHGLERHASQYHLIANYEYAYHFWLLAACWRKEDMGVHGFTDRNHVQAIEYCIKHALYNQALHQWQRGPRTRPPLPESFDLTKDDIDRKVSVAQEQIDSVTGVRGD